jgi:hypothetical protein
MSGKQGSLQMLASDDLAIFPPPMAVSAFVATPTFCTNVGLVI